MACGFQLLPYTCKGLLSPVSFFFKGASVSPPQQGLNKEVLAFRDGAHLHPGEALVLQPLCHLCCCRVQPQAGGLSWTLDPKERKAWRDLMVNTGAS